MTMDNRTQYIHGLTTSHTHIHIHTNKSRETRNLGGKCTRPMRVFPVVKAKRRRQNVIVFMRFPLTPRDTYVVYGVGGRETLWIFKSVFIAADNARVCFFFVMFSRRSPFMCGRCEFWILAPSIRAFRQKLMLSFEMCWLENERLKSRMFFAYIDRFPIKNSHTWTVTSFQLRLIIQLLILSTDAGNQIHRSLSRLYEFLYSSYIN